MNPSSAIKIATDLAALYRKEIQSIRARKVSWEPISAVYFLFDKEKLVYIGSTINLYNRLCQHKEKKKFEWDSYSYESVHPEDLYSKERQSIMKFNPPMNKQVKSRCAI